MLNHLAQFCFPHEVEKSLKIQALDIQVGDRIIAYCDQRMRVCTVKHILDSDQSNINLSVFTAEKCRNASVLRVVRFRRDALVELAS